MNQNHSKNSGIPNSLFMNSSSHGSPSESPDETLRLLAQLEPPIGLTDRVKRRIDAAEASPVRQSFWGLWMPARRLQFTGAALLVVTIAGSAWTVVHHNQAQAAGKGAIQLTPSEMTPSGPAPSGAFSTSGAERHPATLAPIKVPPPHKKKPSASRIKAAAKATTSQPAAKVEINP